MTTYLVFLQMSLVVECFRTLGTLERLFSSVTPTNYTHDINSNKWQQFKDTVNTCCHNTDCYTPVFSVLWSEAFFFQQLRYKKMMASAQNEYNGYKKCIFSGGFRISDTETGGSPIPEVGPNTYYFDKILAEKCMKMKAVGPWGRGVPSAPFGSANEFLPIFLSTKRVDRAIGILTWHGTWGWYVMWRIDDKSHTYELESSSGLLRVFLISTLKQKVNTILVSRCFSTSLD